MKDNHINTYSYEFKVTLTSAILTFKYDLDFINIGENVDIVAPAFEGVAITRTEIGTKIMTINNYLTDYRGLTNSGYNYEVKTEVAFEGELAINSTTKGRTMRNIVDNEVYFWNRVDFSSNYKNADLYKDKGIVDYGRYRVKYASKDVYDVTDRIWPLSDIYNQIPNYDNEALDNYYMLLSSTLLNSNTVSMVSEKAKGSDVTYSIGVN